MIIVPRRIRRVWDKHHRTDIDVYGRVVASNGKDLWKRIQNSRKRYIVDNNWRWERYLGRHEYFQDAFILGTSRLNEQAQLIRLFEDPKGRKKIGKNVFLFSFRAGLGSIQRLEFVISTLNRNKLITLGDLDSPARLAASSDDAKVRDEVLALQSEIRGELVHVLQRGKVIRRACHPTNADRFLFAAIRSQLANCFSNLCASANVARQAFALLLINNQTAKRNFIEKGPINGFHDAALIGNALFFRAEVLSCDEGVREMARYCGVRTPRDLD